MELDVALNKFIALIDEMLQMIPPEQQALREHLRRVKAEAPAALQRYGVQGSGYFMLRVMSAVARWPEETPERWRDFLFPILEQLQDLACEVGGLPNIRFTQQTEEGECDVSR